MVLRPLLAMLLCWPPIAAGQLSGRFFLERETFAPGDPVFLSFEVTNTATETEEVRHADPYAFCSGYGFMFPATLPQA